MKTYPDEKPSLLELTMPILCSLLSSGHYTFPENPEEGDQPGYFVLDNGKKWNTEDEGLPIFTGRYSTRALSHAMEIAMEVIREMDLEEGFRSHEKKAEEPIVPHGKAA